MDKGAYSFNRMFKLAMTPMLLATVSACAAPAFKADVSRFQSQLPAPQGQTFAVVADDPALAGGLEFSQYADLVEARFAALGYTEASPENANLLVRLDYGVDSGRERVTSTGFADPFYDTWGYYRAGFPRYSPFYRLGNRRIGTWSYGFYDPWFAGTSVRSQTIYTSGVDMKIDNQATGQRLFEGKAQAVSTSNRLQHLVPNLVDAMFTDFPGNSGETLRISIAPEKTTVRRID